MAQTAPAQAFLTWKKRSTDTKQLTTTRGWLSWMASSSIGQNTETEASARRKIAAAQRARWAKVKAQQKKAA